MTIRKVLLVDDEPDIRKIGTLALERVGGLEVTQASSGVEALEVGALAKSKFRADSRCVGPHIGDVITLGTLPETNTEVVEGKRGPEGEAGAALNHRRRVVVDRTAIPRRGHSHVPHRRTSRTHPVQVEAVRRGRLGERQEEGCEDDDRPTESGE